MRDNNFELEGYQVPVLVSYNGYLVPAGKFVNNMSAARDQIFKSLASVESFGHRFTRYPSIETIWSQFWIPVVMDQQMVIGFRNTFGSITIQVWDLQAKREDITSSEDAQAPVLIYEEIQRDTKSIKTRYHNNLFHSAWTLTAPNIWRMSGLARIGRII